MTMPATPIGRSAGTQAFARIGEVLRGLPDPNMAEFYTSGRASNEAAFLFQLFAREFGTNNFPDCSNMCHEATSVGLPKSIGIGKGTVSLDDFDHCELIIAIGHNPGTNHPRMMGTLHEVLAARRADHRASTRCASARWSASPTRRTRSEMATLRLDADRVLLLPGEGRRRRRGAEGDHEGAGGAGRCRRRHVLDHDFIARHTNGFEALAADLRATDWADIEAASGPGPRRAGGGRALPMPSPNATIIIYGMGITQHTQGHAERPADRQPAAAARQYRQAGRRHLPAARPFQCAGRPHGRHHREADAGVAGRASSAPSASSRRTHHGHDAVAAMQAMHRRRVQGADLSRRQPRRRACRIRSACFAGHAQPRSFGAYRHQAEPLAPADRQANRSSCPASAAPRWTSRQPGRNRSRSRTRCRWCTPRAASCRRPPSICARSRRSSPAWRWRLCRTRKVDWLDLVADYDRIRDAIEAVFPDFKDYNKRIRVPGGFRLSLPADRTGLEHALRQGRVPRLSRA